MCYNMDTLAHHTESTVQNQTLVFICCENPDKVIFNLVNFKFSYILYTDIALKPLTLKPTKILGLSCATRAWLHRVSEGVLWYLPLTQ